MVNKQKKAGGPQKRAKPYTAMQMEYLTEAIRKRQKVIECKKTDTVVNAEKTVAWQDVTNEFNAHLTPEDGPRTLVQLKGKWKQMKRDAGKVIREIYREWGGTGGGPQWKEKLPALEAKIFSICPKSFLAARTNKYDSDGGQIVAESDCDEEQSDYDEENGVDENNLNSCNTRKEAHCSMPEFQQILDSTIPIDGANAGGAEVQMQNSGSEAEDEFEDYILEVIEDCGDTSSTSVAPSETLNHGQSLEPPSTSKSQGSSNPGTSKKSPDTEDSSISKKVDWSHYNVPALRSKKSDALTLKKGKKRKLYGKTIQEKYEQDRQVLIETQRDYYITLQKQNIEKHNKEMELKNLEADYWCARKAAEERYWLQRIEREEKEAALRMKLVEEELKVMSRGTSSSNDYNDNTAF
nr:PREDICTED: uncharacterized protein LOC109039405 [Bemisia tabaci]